MTAHQHRLICQRMTLTGTYCTNTKLDIVTVAADQAEVQKAGVVIRSILAHNTPVRFVDLSHGFHQL